jgi:hypothetical protein
VDPITLTTVGTGMLAGLLAGTGHADLLRPRVSPGTVRRCAIGATAATVALGVTGPAVAAPHDPGTTPTPTATAPAAPETNWDVTDHRPVDTTRPATRQPDRAPTAPRTPRRTPRRAGGGAWHVQPGDTLSGIAATRRTTVRALVAANADRHPSLATDPDLIRVGWTLRIPGGTR